MPTKSDKELFQSSYSALSADEKSAFRANLIALKNDWKFDLVQAIIEGQNSAQLFGTSDRTRLRKDLAQDPNNHPNGEGHRSISWFDFKLSETITKGHAPKLEELLAKHYAPKTPTVSSNSNYKTVPADLSQPSSKPSKKEYSLLKEAKEKLSTPDKKGNRSLSENYVGMTSKMTRQQTNDFLTKRWQNEVNFSGALLRPGDKAREVIVGRIDQAGNYSEETFAKNMIGKFVSITKKEEKAALERYIQSANQAKAPSSTAPIANREQNSGGFRERMKNAFKHLLFSKNSSTAINAHQSRNTGHNDRAPNRNVRTRPKG